jgi:hypothetical protein
MIDIHKPRSLHDLPEYKIPEWALAKASDLQTGTARKPGDSDCGATPVFTTTGVNDQGLLLMGDRSQIIIDGELFAEVPTKAVPWLKKILLAAAEGVGGSFR